MTNKFCNENYLFFEKNYNLLNDKSVELNFYKTIYSLDIKKHQILDEIIMNKIKENWKGIDIYLNLVKDVFKQLKKSGNLNEFQVNNLINDFLIIEKKIESPETFLQYMKTFIYRKNLYNEIKELLLILSNKYTCELILNEKLKKEKCTKKYIEKIVRLSNGSLDILTKLLYPKVTAIKHNFGKEEYENVFKFFKCLKLMEKHNINPLKALNIGKPNKPKNIEKILDELEINYLIDTGNDFDNKLENVKSIAEYILLLKKRGHTFWFTINYIWKYLYGKELLGKIHKTNAISNNNIENQKNSYNFALKLFILCEDGFISNINIFQEF